MDSGGVNTSKSNQNGVSRDPEVLVRPSRRIIGAPDRLRILAEVDKGRATGGLVKEILRRRPACYILSKFS